MPKMCPFLGAKLVPLTNFNVDGDVYTEHIPKYINCLEERCALYDTDEKQCVFRGFKLDFKIDKQN